MDYKDIVIVIPVYKAPDNDELISINRLCEITQFKYDIVFVRPTLMDASIIYPYYQIMNGWEGHVFEKTFDDSFFESTITYSNLLTTFDFYIQFHEYKFMLIYQPDCYLIRDEIIDWCNLDYDYIGAPIVGTGSGWKKIPCVGNGGFSLRKIETFINITNPDGEFITEFASDIEEANKLNENGYVEFEDLYFAELVPSLTTNFTKPNYELAGRFAWDRNVELLYNKYHGELPMGIHAWQKFKDFWIDKIDIQQKLGN